MAARTSVFSAGGSPGRTAGSSRSGAPRSRNCAAGAAAREGEQPRRGVCGVCGMGDAGGRERAGAVCAFGTKWWWWPEAHGHLAGLLAVWLLALG